MGVLKARVGSSWQAIGTGIGEVFVGPNDPGTNVGIELWYDSDDNSVITASTVGYEANRPAATPANIGLHYFATDTLREWICDGTGWIIMFEPNQTWNPTFTNFTLGNGTIQAHYKRENGWCDIQGLCTLGSTSAMSGDLRISLPFNALNDNVTYYKGHALQTGVNEFPCFIASNVPNTFAIRSLNVAGTYAVQAPFSASVPFTWTTGVQFFFAGRYPMASRYS